MCGRCLLKDNAGKLWSLLQERADSRLRTHYILTMAREGDGRAGGGERRVDGLSSPSQRVFLSHVVQNGDAHFGVRRCVSPLARVSWSTAEYVSRNTADSNCLHTPKHRGATLGPILPRFLLLVRAGERLASPKSGGPNLSLSTAPARHRRCGDSDWALLRNNSIQKSPRDLHPAPRLGPSHEKGPGPQSPVPCLASESADFFLLRSRGVWGGWVCGVTKKARFLSPNSARVR